MTERQIRFIIEHLKVFERSYIIILQDHRASAYKEYMLYIVEDDSEIKIMLKTKIVML